MSETAATSGHDVFVKEEIIDTDTLVANEETDANAIVIDPSSSLTVKTEPRAGIFHENENEAKNAGDASGDENEAEEADDVRTSEKEKSVDQMLATPATLARRHAQFNIESRQHEVLVNLPVTIQLPFTVEEEQELCLHLEHENEAYGHHRIRACPCHRCHNKQTKFVEYPIKVNGQYGLRNYQDASGHLVTSVRCINTPFSSFQLKLAALSSCGTNEGNREEARRWQLHIRHSSGRKVTIPIQVMRALKKVEGRLRKAPGCRRMPAKGDNGSSTPIANGTTDDEEIIQWLLRSYEQKIRRMLPNTRMELKKLKSDHAY